MREMKQLHSSNGFTLIEVLIAMAILTIGILSLFSMQIHSVQGNTKANRQTVESCLGSDQIEQLLAQSYNDTVDGVSPDGTIFWNVAVDCPMPNLKTIRVYVQDNNRPQATPISYQYIKADVI